ncbi:MAG: hypothetical protein SVX43_08270 [Cyanobacteriota bacterium]|nr:hypothetical protein [Cyanobacteriota bacterium]
MQLEIEEKFAELAKLAGRGETIQVALGCGRRSRLGRRKLKKWANRSLALNLSFV